MFGESDLGCNWFVNTRLQTLNGYFYIKDLDYVHMFGATVLMTDNSRASSRLIERLIHNGVRVAPLKRPVEMVRDLKAWRGVEFARDNAFANISLSFEDLRCPLVFQRSEGLKS